MKPKQKELDRALKILERSGYKVKKPVTTVKKTFEVDPALVMEFTAMAKERKLKLKEAIDEAIRAWLEKK